MHDENFVVEFFGKLSRVIVQLRSLGEVINEADVIAKL